MLRARSGRSGPAGHRERARDGHLHRAGRCWPRKSRSRTCTGGRDRPDDARNGLAWPLRSSAVGVVEVDPLERGGEAVRVALPPDLAVRDDVEPGGLLSRMASSVASSCASSSHCGSTRHTRRAHAGREASGKHVAVDQPVGLGVGADEARGESRGHSRAVFRICAATSSAACPSVLSSRSAPATGAIARACSTSSARPDHRGGSRAMMRAASVSGWRAGGRRTPRRRRPPRSAGRAPPRSRSYPPPATAPGRPCAAARIDPHVAQPRLVLERRVGPRDGLDLQRGVRHAVIRQRVDQRLEHRGLAGAGRPGDQDGAHVLLESWPRAYPDPWRRPAPNPPSRRSRHRPCAGQRRLRQLPGRRSDIALSRRGLGRESRSRRLERSTR